MSVAAPKTTRTPGKVVRILLPLLLVFAWIGVTGVGGPYFGKISEVSTNSATDFLPETAESTQVVQQQSDFYVGDIIPAITMFKADGELTEAQRAWLDQLPATFAKTGAVEGETSPVIYSEDGQAAEIVVPLPASAAPADGVDALTDIIAEAPEGLDAYVTGPAGFAASLGEAFAGIDGVLLLVALAVVFVILLVVYRSPIIPIIALMTSMVALSGAILVVWNMANAGWVMINGQVQGILLFLVWWALPPTTPCCMWHATARRSPSTATALTPPAPRSRVAGNLSLHPAAPSLRVCSACCSRSSPQTRHWARWQLPVLYSPCW